MRGRNKMLTRRPAETSLRSGEQQRPKVGNRGGGGGREGEEEGLRFSAMEGERSIAPGEAKAEEDGLRDQTAGEDATVIRVQAVAA